MTIPVSVYSSERVEMMERASRSDPVQPFLVVGAGNNGLATAAYLTVHGLPVVLWNRSSTVIETINSRGGITCRIKGQDQAKVAPAYSTSSLEKAFLRSPKFIIITVPANAHREVAERLCPFLLEGMVLILTPGRTGGCQEFRSVLASNGVPDSIQIAETQTTLFTSRSLLAGEVDIFEIKNCVHFAALPSCDTICLAEKLRPTFPNLIPVGSTMETGLNNTGCILHCAPVLFNIGWIESPKVPFRYYYDGITKTIADYCQRMDDERVAVGNRIGIPMRSILQWIRDTYLVDENSLWKALQSIDSYSTIDAPTTLSHRYILEDVPTGLVPISELGRELGVDTPYMDLTISLADAVMKRSFRDEGRRIIPFAEKHDLL